MKRHVLAMLVVGSMFIAMGCGVAVRGPGIEVSTPTVTVGTSYYTPLYHDGYILYFDTVGRPYYYVGGAVVYVPPGHPYYSRYTLHYRTHGAHYRRWHTTRGHRYRTYRRGHTRGHTRHRTRQPRHHTRRR